MKAWDMPSFHSKELFSGYKMLQVGLGLRLDACFILLSSYAMR